MNTIKSSATKTLLGALALLTTALGVTSAQPVNAAVDAFSTTGGSSTAVKTISPKTSTQLKSKMLKSNMAKTGPLKSIQLKNTIIKTIPSVGDSASGLPSGVNK